MSGLGNTEIKALWKDSAVIPTTFTITFNANECRQGLFVSIRSASTRLERFSERAGVEAERAHCFCV